MFNFSFKILHLERNFNDPEEYDIEKVKYFLRIDAN